MYTVKERIERNGVLVAFAGKVITDQQARELGLLVDEAEKPEKPSKKAAKKTTKKPKE